MSIESAIGYRFRDERLLKEALTHPGCAQVVNGAPFNYQRLEFLGDSVLALVTAELIYELFPAENEGNLAKRHAALVCSATLAQVGRELDLGTEICLPPGDESARANSSSLEDVCEAVIGALYLDGGFAAARDFIRRHWQPIAHAVSEPPRDAKTALQEWAQGRGLPLPHYQLLEATGPAHAPYFTIAVAVGGQEPVTAQAASKRQAEQLAAKAFLEKMHG